RLGRRRGLGGPRTALAGVPRRPPPADRPGGIVQPPRGRRSAVVGRGPHAGGRVPPGGTQLHVPAVPNRRRRHPVGGRREDRRAPRWSARRVRAHHVALVAAASRVIRGQSMETRILIVDDDPFICRQLEELYSSQRYTVSCAPNATEALRLLGEQDF